MIPSDDLTRVFVLHLSQPCGKALPPRARRAKLNIYPATSGPVWFHLQRSRLHVSAAGTVKEGRDQAIDGMSHHSEELAFSSGFLHRAPATRNAISSLDLNTTASLSRPCFPPQRSSMHQHVIAGTRVECLYGARSACFGKAHRPQNSMSISTVCASS